MRAGGSYAPSFEALVGAASAVRPFGAPSPPARIPAAGLSLGEPQGGERQRHARPSAGNGSGGAFSHLQMPFTGAACRAVALPPN